MSEKSNNNYFDEKLIDLKIEERINQIINKKLFNDTNRIDLNFYGNIIDSVKKHNNDKVVMHYFFDLLFKRDFNELHNDAPLWISLVTEFYYHKEDVIQLMRILEIETPDNIDKFRLPLDWNESELDVFFNTLQNHSNTNQLIYRSNLKFWAQNALLDVLEMCNTQYSNIPWQYVLRNPLLKQEKYLRKIGKSLCGDIHGYKFYRILDFQSLDNNQIKIILDNIDYISLSSKSEVYDFILKCDLSLIDNPAFLDKIYRDNVTSYTFKVSNKIFEMPYNYRKSYIEDNLERSLDYLSSKSISNINKLEILNILSCQFKELIDKDLDD